MAESAVAFLQEQLKDVIIGYSNLISGAEAELTNLNNDLDLLKSFLKETAMKMKKDDQLQLVQKRIRDVVYEVEDIIDICLTKAMEGKAKKFRGYFSHTLNRLSLAKEVKSIRESRIQPLFYDIRMMSEMKKLGDGSESNEQSSIHSGGARIPIKEDEVVGFEYEARCIIEYLMTETDYLDVISIIGMPGQGKTVLARMIYASEVIMFRFPIRIWLAISQKFKIRDIFLHILKQVDHGEQIQDWSKFPDEDLVSRVRTCLEEDNFLLVLDDVWSTEAWSQIKEALPLRNGKGKVLITSRDFHVGVRCNVHRIPHNLRCLTIDESWTLLQHVMFGKKRDCPPELADIGQLIAKRCHGLPLTIVVIGMILIRDLNRIEWEKVAENVVDHAVEGDSMEVLKKVVELSYQALGDGMRECFLYLGVFPEDYEIPAKMLLGLWIAEGYILPQRGISLEESAEMYLEHLISKNLIQAVKTNHSGRVKTCRVHDMIRAFCIHKSRDENIFDEIHISDETAKHRPRISEVRNSHRLSLRSGLSMFLSQTPKGPNVRSLMCFYEHPVKLEPQYVSVIPDNFPRLRILECKCIIFDRFPAKLTKLAHLRYLTLYIESLQFLPEPITQLWNLQSLVVETRSSSITMKGNLWTLVRLRYLKTRAAIILDHKWKGEAGDNLHTLKMLAPESCTEAVSEKARNLRTLGISGDLTKMFQNKFLENLDHLEKLKLVNRSTYQGSPEKMVQSLPERNCFPPNLKRLTLINTFLPWQHMSTLAMIHNLEVLKLKDNAFIGTFWTAAEYSFPCLEMLLVSNADLLVWEASSRSFPSLQHLVLKSCENLTQIPVFLSETLQNLEIERLPESAVASARKIIQLKKHAPDFKFSLAPTYD